MDKPRQQFERRAATVSLASRLETGTRSKGDQTELVRLIKEERAVQEWAANAESKSSNEGYKANMAKAQTTSLEVERKLKEALGEFKAGHLPEAAALLIVVAGMGSKATKSPAGSMTKLYQQYQIETDTKFHAWLEAHGHTLPGVSVAVPARGGDRQMRVRFRPDDGRSNNPKDYE